MTINPTGAIATNNVYYLNPGAQNLDSSKNLSNANSQSNYGGLGKPGNDAAEIDGSLGKYLP